MQGRSPQLSMELNSECVAKRGDGSEQERALRWQPAPRPHSQSVHHMGTPRDGDPHVGSKPQGWLWFGWTWLLPARKGNQASLRACPRETGCTEGFWGEVQCQGGEQGRWMLRGPLERRCPSPGWAVIGHSSRPAEAFRAAACQQCWGRQCWQASPRPEQRQGADVGCGMLQAGIPRSARDSRSCSWHRSGGLAPVCIGSVALLLACSPAEKPGTDAAARPLGAHHLPFGTSGKLLSPASARPLC